MKTTFILFSFFLLSSCSGIKPYMPSHQKKDFSRLSLIGTWYQSVRLQNGSIVERQVEHFADGTYREFTKTSLTENINSTSLELGQWGVSGDILFITRKGWVEGCSIVTPNVDSAENYNAYQIDLLTTTKLQYHHLSQPNGFKLIKQKNHNLMKSANSMMEDCAYMSKKTRAAKIAV